MDLIIKFLNTAGLCAERIPEAPNKKRADILAIEKQLRFLIEVKDKESLKPILELERQLGNVVATREKEEYSYHNVIDSIISGAARQLASTFLD